jgi:putative hemolysin
MKAALALMILSLALAACETPSTEAGSADYDALRRASADCAAEGGKLVLKDQGDPERINAYVCKRT